MKNEKDLLKIKDSGNRKIFKSGAVRDIQKGKGRCDLLPFDVVSSLYLLDKNKTASTVFANVFLFCKTGNVEFIKNAILKSDIFADLSTMFLEISKHFENGAKKYGERNWEKGIPVERYIDSGLRHYFKYLRGDTDEYHDRAFIWNMMCLMWTCSRYPDLNPYGKKKNEI